MSENALPPLPSPDSATHHNLLLVSTSYPSGETDWRGVFIRHLVEAFARRIDLRIKLWAPPGQRPSNVEDVATPIQRRWLERLMAAGGIAHLVRRGGLTGWSAPLRLLKELREVYRRTQDVDVYHVNWLQNAIPLPANRIPLLVTVLGTDMQLLRMPGMDALLRRSFKRRRVAICPNAQWMVPELNDRFGEVATVRFLPFGIDPLWFLISRRPAPVPRWLCVTRLTRAKIGSLFEWGEAYFSDGSRELHLLGPMQEELKVPPWVHYHGATTAEALRAEWFPTAHGLITLSQHSEGWPQVMLEAMAAGLPLIASRIPAHEDLLGSRKGGVLCSDVDELGEALAQFESWECNASIGQLGREWSQNAVGTWDDCVDRYVRIHRELLER